MSTSATVFGYAGTGLPLSGDLYVGSCAGKFIGSAPGTTGITTLPSPFILVPSL